jgi:hypothetical protein
MEPGTDDHKSTIGGTKEKAQALPIHGDTNENGIQDQ